MAGRSNVGKSSLINCLVGRRRLAPISSAPGKTKTIRFYVVDDTLALVDLPGYGYAKVSRSLRDAWKKLVEKYFATRPALAAALHVVDIRHPGLKNDLLLWDWLAGAGVESLVVATKADKVSRGERARLSAAISDSLHLSEDGLIVFSAVTGEGKDGLWRWMLSKRDSIDVAKLRATSATASRGAEPAGRGQSDNRTTSRGARSRAQVPFPSRARAGDRVG